MVFSKKRVLWKACGLLVAVCLSAAGRATIAGGVPRALSRSFAFPASIANGVTGDLVVPAGSTTHLRFATAKVAIGQLPVPLPQSVARRRHRAGLAREFLRPADLAPYARLMLNGVVDENGNLVTNAANQLVIDAAVSPSGAASDAPPFTILFDIRDGAAFVDAPLPIQSQTTGPVRVQVLGVTIIDPDGQPFGVLGFELPPARPSRIPLATPTPGGTPQVEGQCFIGADCTGVSFQASQDQCCRLVGRSDGTLQGATSWCPPDQFDPATGHCMANGCVACAIAPPPPDCQERAACGGRCALPCPNGDVRGGVCARQASDGSCHCAANCEEQPTPTPGPCSDGDHCQGSCTVTCADGTAVAGKCISERDDRCACSATCSAPPPCAVGQCFDTIAFACTGQACDPNGRCPLPNQFCDLSGRRCPCAPPPHPLPHGRICCQCTDPAHACFEIPFVEVQPICPSGCDTFVDHQCDAETEGCVPLAPCRADADCDDLNGCTVDRCTASGCEHDCVCVGPLGCGPGPARVPGRAHGHRPHH